MKCDTLGGRPSALKSSGTCPLAGCHASPSSPSAARSAGREELGVGCGSAAGYCGLFGRQHLFRAPGTDERKL